MSKTVKVKLLNVKDIKYVKENEKCIKKTAEFLHDTNMTLMSTILKNKLISGEFCGGRGVCGRCRLHFLEGAPVPTALDRKFLAPEKLREGYRLACAAKPKSDCVVRADFLIKNEIDIVTEAAGLEANAEDSKNIDYNSQSHMIAVDLGTTTIAMQLMDMESGRILDTYCSMNPQRSFGADVLSRVKAAEDGFAEVMKESVWEVITAGIERFVHISIQGKPVKICCMCIAGNTVMTHLLMGLSTKGLGQSPFTPDRLGLQRFTLPEYDFAVYIIYGISAFIGGDIAAGLYHCGLLDWADSGRDREETVLFIDLGTNGELALADKNGVIATATAAGPAFEGGAGARIIGSDMVRITAELLKNGFIDNTGLLSERYDMNGGGSTGSADIRLTQIDVRQLQMAKAAVRAGIEILCNKAGAGRVDRVCLAGGFGYYLDIDAAVYIGLLPETLKEFTVSEGNTSLAGAFEIGRDLWNKSTDIESLKNRMQKVRTINLANEKDFEKLYINNLNFY